MSSYVENQLHLLEALKKASPKLRRAIITNAEAELIEAISEICYNYINGNVECDTVHYDDLKKHKACLRLLAKSESSPDEASEHVKASPEYERAIAGKREILLQQGDGFWVSLLAPLVSELASHFISKFVKKSSSEEGVKK